MSKNVAQSPLHMRTAPVAISGMPPQTPTRKRRYYVILVGKCTGIHYDEWQVFYFLRSLSCLLTFLNPSRENVEPLICHVSNARFKGFSTHDQGEEFYLDVKLKNNVRIVRDPGDDQKYGPMDVAIQ